MYQIRYCHAQKRNLDFTRVPPLIFIDKTETLVSNFEYYDTNKQDSKSFEKEDK